jgi:hypothetical protein
MLKLNCAASWMLFLAAGVAFQHPAWAQTDRPIIIHGGSPLVIEQNNGDALRVRDDHTLVSAYPDNTVTRVEVEWGPFLRHRKQSFEFNREECNIRLSFGDIQLEVQTDAQGKNLQIVANPATSFRQHFRQTGARFEHKPSGAGPAFMIGTIRKARRDQPAVPASGHTKVVIHNEAL